MKKLILVAAAILLPFASSASTTYAVTASGVKATATTGSESAPTVVTEGLSLGSGPSICGIAVIAETAGTMTAGGLLNAYVWNPESTSWVRLPDRDLTVAALAKQAFDGVWVPVATAGSRITWVPSGVGVAVTIYMNAQPCK